MSAPSIARRKNISACTRPPERRPSPCAPSGGCTRRLPRESLAIPSRRLRPEPASSICRACLCFHSPWWASRQEEGGFNTEFREDPEITAQGTGRAGQAPPVQICGNAFVSCILEVAFFGFVEKILGGAPGERHDRECRIFVRVGDQRRAIGDKQILHLVRLAETIEHGGLRIGAHARGAHLVNNLAARLNPKGILAVDRSLGPIFAAHGLDD